MRLHKLKTGDSTGTYLVESLVTETDILLVSRQLANLRLRRGRSLTSPKAVFSHLQALLGDYEHEVSALLHLDRRRQGSPGAQRHRIGLGAPPSLRGSRKPGGPQPDPQAEGGTEPGRGADAGPHHRRSRRLSIVGRTGSPVRRK